MSQTLPYRSRSIQGVFLLVWTTMLIFGAFTACKQASNQPPDQRSNAEPCPGFEAQFKLAVVLKDSQDYKSAEIQFREAAFMALKLRCPARYWAKSRVEMARCLRLGDTQNGKTRSRDSLLADLKQSMVQFPNEAGLFHFHLARTFYTLNDFEAAKGHYAAAVKAHEGGNYVTKGAGQYLYLPYSEIFTRLGEYEKAINIQKIALDSSRAQEDATGELLILGDIGISYASMDLPDSAQIYYRKSAELARAYPIKKGEEKKRATHLGMVFSDWAATLNTQGKRDSARLMLDASLNLFPENAEALSLLGYMHVEDKRFAEAEAPLQQAEKLYEEEGVSLNRSLAKIILRRAQLTLIHPRNQSTEAALLSCQRALQYVLPAFQYEGVFDNPDDRRFYPENTILEALELKSRLTWELYVQSGELKWLDLTEKSAELALKAHHTLLEAYGFESSKFIALQQVRDLYERVIKVLFERRKYNTSEALDNKILAFNEQSRAVLLREKRGKEDALLAAPIPTSIKDELSALRRSLVAMRNELVALESKGADTEPLRRSIFSKEETLQQRMKQLEQDFPAWFKSQSLENADVAAIRALVKSPGTTLVQHFFHAPTGQLYLSALSAQGLQTAVQQLDPSGIEFFISQLRNRELGFNAEGDTTFLQDFVQQSQELYQRLLAPVMGAQPPKALILIPDGIIGNVPFDILLPRLPEANEWSFRRLPYLIRSCAVQYAPSAGMLVMANEKQYPSSGYLGMAPAYSGFLKPTTFGAASTQALTTMFGGQYINNALASKESFVVHAPKAQILHFYGHGKANSNKPEQSFLAFSKSGTGNSGKAASELAVAFNLPVEELPRVLMAHEIRSLNLQSELVLLSACETGIGKDAGPEGALSLARAFWDAGSPATVMSMWSVDDESTAFLSRRFMEYIKARKPKNEALQQAKLDYLQEANSAIPYFWAGLALTGSAKAIDFRPGPPHFTLGQESVPLSTLLLAGALLAFTGLLLGLVFRGNNKV